MSHDLGNLLDLERYPLDRPESEGYLAAVGEARAGLRSDGCAIVRSLVRPDALRLLDDEIVEAMCFLFETVKIVAEPSGATALAAVLHGHLDAGDRVTGVTISGGNVDVHRFAELVADRPPGTRS